MLLRDNIWLCDAVKSPFILGIIHPQIYLSSSTNEKEINYILAHEQAHLKRKDHWWKLSGYLLLTIYWFHPLVWLAYILFCRDIELACDEKVIREMNIDGKKAYSNALLACSMQKKIIAIYPLAFGEIGVKERIKIILNYKKPKFGSIMAAIITCAVVSICFLTNPKDNISDAKIIIPAGSEEAFHYSTENTNETTNPVNNQYNNSYSVISNLLETICSSPSDSSDPQDHIDAHPTEYDELINYGEHTLRYCFNRFHHGNETGLDGKIMAFVCEELLESKDKIPANASTSETGQLWYDTLFAHGSNKVEPYLENN